MMKKIGFIIMLITAIIQTSCEKDEPSTWAQNSRVALICDITWVGEKIINDEGITYQTVYEFKRNGIYEKTSISIDKDGIERQSTFRGEWSFSDPGYGSIYFGYRHYWDIVELTEKKFSVYDRSGEWDDPFMTKEYVQHTPKE